MKTIMKEGICIITPETGQLDITNATTFGSEISKLINGENDYILSLESVNFMDSSGLGKIIELIRLVKEKERKIVLCNIRDAVKVLFTMVNLSQIVSLHASVTDAENFLIG
ncbi:MAG: STAS domain-containing protein [Spirochaetales bacterium]|nr:STAS domain-containing protein [Spirochaetales bacterium]